MHMELIKQIQPSRILKLYGTIGRKGDNTPERPHRRSQIWLPQGIERIDFETLESIVIDAYGVDEETPREASSQRSEQKTRMNISLREWLDQHKIPYTEKPYKGTSKFQVDCPHDPTHKSPDAWLTDEGGNMAI